MRSLPKAQSDKINACAADWRDGMKSSGAEKLKLLFSIFSVVDGNDLFASLQPGGVVENIGSLVQDLAADVGGLLGIFCILLIVLIQC